jgi:hypothetical protein
MPQGGYRLEQDMNDHRKGNGEEDGVEAAQYSSMGLVGFSYLALASSRERDPFELLY